MANGFEAVWKNNDYDQPVKITGMAGEINGRKYVNIEGSTTGIPLDEILDTKGSPIDSDLIPRMNSSTVVHGAAQKPIEEVAKNTVEEITSETVESIAEKTAKESADAVMLNTAKEVGSDAVDKAKTFAKESADRLNLDGAMMKKFGSKVGLIGIGLFAANMISGKEREEGKSIASYAVESTAIAIVGPGKLAMGAALLKGPGAAVEAYEKVSLKARQMSRMGSASPFMTNTFIDNKQIYTMRQASMAMIQRSRYMAEHAMQGNEAGYLHR